VELPDRHGACAERCHDKQGANEPQVTTTIEGAANKLWGRGCEIAVTERPDRLMSPPFSSGDRKISWHGGTPGEPMVSEKRRMSVRQYSVLPLILLVVPLFLSVSCRIVAASARRVSHRKIARAIFGLNARSDHKAIREAGFRFHR